MRFTIKRGLADVVSNVRMEGNITHRIMGEELLEVSFTLTSKIIFHIGDHITAFGKTYFLLADPATVKKNNREYNYSMSFGSIKYSLSDIQVFQLDNNQELTMPDFSIMGNLSTCLDLVLMNINRVSSGWSKGVVDETEVKNVSFSDNNCLQAISKLAEEFKLEYWIDDDQSIHFTKRAAQSGYTFKYGKGMGLKSITRANKEDGSLVTRLYVKGSDKNLPKNYRSGQKSLRIDVPYLENNIGIYGIKEHTEKFEDIYPKRIGTVTAVSETDPHIFTDADLDFDLNSYNEYGSEVLMPGLPAKVIFQTGQLAGYRLELIEAGGFNSLTKTFYLNTNKDEKDMEVPSELLRPAVGDKYILEDIMMPEVYVVTAEAELKTKAEEYLEQNSVERFQFSVESDPIYFKNQNVNLKLGETVKLIDSPFKLDDDVRVTGLVQNINNPYDVQFDLSDVATPSSIIKTYYEQEQQQTTIVNQIKYNAALARRNYMFGREFHDKVFDGEGYFDMENIKPLSIETKMISLGSRLQQFGLPGVNFKIQNNNKLTNTVGKLEHQTIDPEHVRSWDIAANEISGISSNFNYIFIKCQKNGTNANFVVTETPIKVEEVADFYHFEVGYLSSVIDGFRKIKTTYGFAQLNPAELSIGRISDPTGNNYIDLLQDKIDIKAKVTFTADSPAIGQIGGMIDNIKIGTRNIARNSELCMWSPNDTGYGTAVNMGTYVRITPKAGKVVSVYRSDGASSSSWNSNAPHSMGIMIRHAHSSALTVWGKQIPPNQWTWLTLEPDSSNTQYPLLITNIAGVAIDVKQFMFVEGNKVGAWSKAPEDIQEQIDNNMQALANWASDNILNPIEKKLLKQMYDNILIEYQQMMNKVANLYGNPPSTVNYTAKYNALNTFISTLGLFDNLTTSTEVNGELLRTKFQDYYTEYAKLDRAIQDSNNNSLENQQDIIDETILNVIDLEKTTDFLTQTSIQGNAVATGTLLVGNADGANGGITGLDDGTLGEDSIALWFGKNFENRKTAPFRVSRNGKLALENKIDATQVKGMYMENGELIWRDENNIIRRRINMLDFKTYSANGTLLWEVNETGHHTYIITDSYVAVGLVSLFNSNETANDTEIGEYLSDRFVIEDEDIGGYGTKYQHTKTLPINLNCYKYNAGNSDAGNLQYEGYKKTQSKTNNIDNGWYTPTNGELYKKVNGLETTLVTFTIECWYVKNGKITQARNITITI